MYRKSLIYKFAKKCEKPDNSVFWQIMNCIFSEVMIKMGFLLYLYYKHRYPNTELLFIPSADAGDLLFLRYSYPYIQKIYGTDTKLFLDGRNKKIAEVLGLPNVELVSQLQIVPLAKAFYYYGDKKLKRLHSVYHWCFFDMQDATDAYIKDTPVYQVDQKAVEEIFISNNLIPGKTVVLAPYEQGITSSGYSIIPQHVWEELAYILTKNEYTVCTNCKGDALEPVVKGTSHVFPTLDNISAFVAKAGYMIAIRSGFCDFTVDTSAKKVILYPSDRYYERWSVYNFGCKGDCMELQYDAFEKNGLWNQLINQITMFLESEENGYEV